MKQPARKPPRRPRLEEAHPDRAAKALQVYASTNSLAAAGRAVGSSHSTVQRLVTRQPVAFEQIKKDLAAKALEYSEAAQSVAMAKVNQLSAMQAAIASKVASQQALELTERQSVVSVTVSQIVEALATLRALRESIAKDRALPAQVVDVHEDGGEAGD